MELISQAEYARRRGVSRQLVNRLTKQERIPTHNGKINPVEADQVLDREFDEKESKNGSSSSENNFYKEKTRLESLKADLYEIKLASERKKVVPVEVVLGEFEKLVKAVKQRLAGMGKKLSLSVAHETDPKKIKVIIDDAILEACSEFRQYDAKTGKCRSTSPKKGNRKASRKHKSTRKNTNKRVGKQTSGFVK